MELKTSSQLLKKAEIELRETEVRRKQSLQQMREWLKKHPFLRNCRDGKLIAINVLIN
jgi:hypothetical protein